MICHVDYRRNVSLSMGVWKEIKKPNKQKKNNEKYWEKLKVNFWDVVYLKLSFLKCSSQKMYTDRELH